MYRAIGASVPAQATCPPCSYLWEGHCQICEAGDPHPGCDKCVDGKPEAPSWWKSDLVPAVVAGVVVSLAVALIVPRVEKAIAKR